MNGGRWMMLAGLVIGLAGCGHSGGSAPATSAAGGSAAPAAVQTAGGPDRAVFEFLEAVRTGNDDKAAKMLTPLARQKVAEQHLVVAPQGTDTARFEVGAAQLLPPDGARVSVKWSDLDESGKRRTDEVTWMLRQVDEGWRVAGVAAPVFEGEPPLLLNFEDPADMIEKQKMVRDEVKRRAEQAAAQTTGATATAASNAAPAQGQQTQGYGQSPPAQLDMTAHSQGADNSSATQSQQAAKSENSVRR